MTRWPALIALLTFATIAACSGSSGSSQSPPESSTSDTSPGTSTPPDGSGSGTAFSGEYELEIETKSCSGPCPLEPAAFGLTASYCDVGEVNSHSWEFRQQDGHLLVKEVDLSFPLPANGGVNADGIFTVSGQGTHLAGSLRGSLEIRGKLVGEGSNRSVQGTATTHTVGTYDGGVVNCTAVFELRSPE